MLSCTLSAEFADFFDTAAFSIHAGTRESSFRLVGEVAHWALYVGEFRGKAVYATFMVDDDPEWRQRAERHFGRSDWCGSLSVAASLSPTEIPPDDLGGHGQISPIQIFVRTPVDSWHSLRATCQAAFAAGHGINGSFQFWWPEGSEGSEHGCFLEDLDVTTKKGHPIFSVSLSRARFELPPRTEGS